MKPLKSPIIIFLLIALVIAFAASQSFDSKRGPVADKTVVVETEKGAETDAYTPPQVTEEQAGDESTAATEETAVAVGETEAVSEEATPASDQVTPEASAEAMEGAPPAPVVEGPSVLDALQRFDTHEKIRKLIANAGVEAMFEGENDITFFAPTDAAFDKMEEGAFEKLETASPEELQEFLKRYTVEGKFDAATLVKQIVEGQAELTSLADTKIALSQMDGGGPLAIQLADGEKAMLPYTDIMARNAVVHVTPVLLP